MKLTMFYDSTCILCRSEAMSLARLSKGNVRIISVLDGQAQLAKANISYAEAMTHLCVMDELGGWHKGMNAVRILYQVADIHLWRFSAYRLFNLPIISTLLDFAYPYFAKHRHLMPAYLVKWWYGAVYDTKLNQLCDDGSCAVRFHRR